MASKHRTDYTVQRGLRSGCGHMLRGEWLDSPLLKLKDVENFDQWFDDPPGVFFLSGSSSDRTFTRKDIEIEIFLSLIEAFRARFGYGTSRLLDLIKTEISRLNATMLSDLIDPDSDMIQILFGKEWVDPENNTIIHFKIHYFVVSRYVNKKKKVYAKMHEKIGFYKI